MLFGLLKLPNNKLKKDNLISFVIFNTVLGISDLTMLSKLLGVLLCVILFHKSFTSLAGCVINRFPLNILQK